MSNEEMRASWTSGGEGWVRNERIFDAIFTPFTAALVGAADLGPGRRVLDVGCGAGTLLSAAVDAGAEAVGIDISPTMAEAARRRVPSATVLVDDAQTVDLLAAAGAPFDRVVSRFGVMFFADPVAAFSNLAAATAPGARLAFVCWRADQFDGFALGLAPLLARFEGPAPLPRVGEPGPLGLGERSRVEQVVTDAGWTDLSIEPVDGVLDYAIDGGDGVEERLAVALSGSTGRVLRAQLEPALGPYGWAAVLDEARTELRTHLIDGAVRVPSGVWLVTASRPV